MVALNEITPPEEMVCRMGILLVACCGLWALFRGFGATTKSVDPWDNATEELIQADDAVPLCHRCLTPHDEQVYFCPECGASVGTYTNLMPFPYLFSIGSALRTGTEGKFRRSPLTIAGFILLGIAEFGGFAPVYWFMFLRTILRDPPSKSSESSPPTKLDSENE